jgi:hypothetical protein
MISAFFDVTHQCNFESNRESERHWNLLIFTEILKKSNEKDSECTPDIFIPIIATWDLTCHTFPKKLNSFHI